MFRKILIANRGEIACRIVRTARRMGIATVAVHSDADANALHVRAADEAVRIGPAPARASYLSIEAIVSACKATGAEAVHPGYGFLSENACFAERLAAEGIVFVGPNARAVEAMGDKIRSKEIAAAAGVSTVPGHASAVESASDAERIAAVIGYPVMIKASAGGGGKGMRVARDAGALREGFERARSEAASSFGDDRVLIEKLIVNPRHIEIQVLGDRHGNVVHLGERECSIQRRNQKVVEEAPSPFVGSAMRERMGRQAVALAKAVGYDSAGTVEFVVGEDGAHYFLEMNARLQVEHPVTECVTGLDLVEEMIRIAGGEALRHRQQDITLRGWAVESRIYAEDPSRGFLPSTGRITTYAAPCEAGVRIDSGVEEGGEISIHYDPMIAKLVTHAPTREAAIEAQGEALDRFAIEGVRHNVAFLSALMAHPRWRAGALSTGFLGEEFPDGFSAAEPVGEAALPFLLAAATIDAEQERRDRPAGMRDDGSAFERSKVIFLGSRDYPVTVRRNEDVFAVTLADGRVPHVRSRWLPGDPVWRGTIDGAPLAMQVRPILNGVVLSRGGYSADALVLAPRHAELYRLMPKKRTAGSARQLRCPMPGIVRAVLVCEGQEVRTGEGLAVVEAMKMENLLRAERDGTVAVLHAAEGDVLAVDDVILEFA